MRGFNHTLILGWIRIKVSLYFGSHDVLEVEVN